MFMVFNATSRTKMASESTVFYEKLAGAVRNYPCLYDKSSDDFNDTNIKSFSGKMLQKRLVLALVSEHYSAVFLNKII